MPAIVRPVGDERDALQAFLDHERHVLLIAAHGLTDEQARTPASVSTLTVGGLLKHVTKAAPRGRRKAPTALGEVPAETPESQALAKDLRKRGFRFVGPTTVYAAMQSLGIVNDHLAGCHARQPCETARRQIELPKGATT